MSKEELDREYEQSKQDMFEEIMNSGTSFEFEDDEDKPKPDHIETFEKKEPNQPMLFSDCDRYLLKRTLSSYMFKTTWQNH